MSKGANDNGSLVLRSIRDRYVPPVRRWSVTLGIGAALGACGIVAFSLSQQAINDRVAEGQVVSAEVTRVWSIPVQRIDPPQRVRVRYVVDRHTYSADLVAALASSSYETGDTIELYVDRTNPRRVATSDKLASEGLPLLVPPALIFYSFFTVVLVFSAALRWH